MENVCRICLNSLTNKSTMSIYNCFEDDMKIYLKINDVGGIFIPEKDQNLPNLICMECCVNLSNSYKFRNLCRASDEQLKNNIHLIKTEPAIAMPIKDSDSDFENVNNYSNNCSPMPAEDCNSDSENNFTQNCKIEIVEEQMEEKTQQTDISYNLKLIYKLIPEDSGIRRHLCKICKKKISGGSYHLKRHLQNEKHQSKLLLMKNSEEENFEITQDEVKKKLSLICEICGRVFDQKYKFRNHKLLHIEQKSHACEICNKKFRVKKQLQSHMRVHTGEKPYKCSFCEKCFAHFNTRKQHEKTHTNERPYECSVCDKRFRQKTARNYHMKIHTGEKPFSCDICDLSFIKKYHIDRHYKSKSHQKLVKEKE